MTEAASDATNAEVAAVQAAEEWLARIDQGDVHGSYTTAAILFRQAVTEAKWRGSMEAAQRPLGRALRRDLHSRKYATELPGAPDGEYVILEYGTAFERKRNGGETVVMMKDPDGSWRLSGYWIR